MQWNSTCVIDCQARVTGGCASRSRRTSEGCLRIYQPFPTGTFFRSQNLVLRPAKSSCPCYRFRLRNRICLLECSQPQVTENLTKSGLNNMTFTISLNEKFGDSWFQSEDNGSLMSPGLEHFHLSTLPFLMYCQRLPLQPQDQYSSFTHCLLMCQPG